MQLIIGYHKFRTTKGQPRKANSNRDISSNTTSMINRKKAKTERLKSPERETNPKAQAAVKWQRQDWTHSPLLFLKLLLQATNKWSKVFNFLLRWQRLYFLLAQSSRVKSTLELRASWSSILSVTVFSACVRDTVEEDRTRGHVYKMWFNQRPRFRNFFVRLLFPTNVYVYQSHCLTRRHLNGSIPRPCLRLHGFKYSILLQPNKSLFLAFWILVSFPSLFVCEVKNIG